MTRVSDLGINSSPYRGKEGKSDNAEGVGHSQEDEAGTGSDRPATQYAVDDEGAISLKGFVDEEQCHKNHAADQETNHCRRAPWLRYASPLHGHEETKDPRKHQNGSNGIEAHENLPDGRSVALLGTFRSLEEQQHTAHRDATNGQVDVEAPPPRHIRRERASQQRARDTGYREHGSHEADDDGLYMERNDECRDGVATVRHARGAETLDGSAANQGYAVR